MKKYNIVLVIVLIIAFSVGIMYNVLGSFAGGYDAKYKYLKITMINFSQNQFDIEVYKDGEKREYTMPKEYPTNVFDENGLEIMKKVEDNEIKYYSEYNAISSVPGTDFTDTVKIIITKNNGEKFEKNFNFEYDKNVYYNYEFDCETGNLIEKDVDESDMPHIASQKFRDKINNTIKAIYYLTIIVTVLYVIFYIDAFVKNRKS